MFKILTAVSLFSAIGLSVAGAQTAGAQSQSIQMPVPLDASGTKLSISIQSGFEADGTKTSLTVYSVWRQSDGSRIATTRPSEFANKGYVVESIIGYLQVP